MNKFQFLFAFLLICVTCKRVSASAGTRCWEKPYCYCRFEKLVSISCKNIEDLSDLGGLFKKHPSINRLRIAGNFTSIHGKDFDKLSVIALKLVSPLKAIEDDSFMGIKNLKSILLQHTSFERIPIEVTRKPIEILRLTHGLIDSVYDELQNMTTVTTIVLRYNRISFISSSAFCGTENVKTLDLSHNELLFLDQEVFTPMKFLKNIDLKKNQLYTITGCFDTLHPRKIDLYGNNLTSIDYAFHTNMWRMKVLDLGGNPHLRLSASTFNDSMKSLSKLYLSDIGFDDMDPSLLKNFRMLYELHLNRNNISYFPQNFFVHSPFLNNLQASDNRLKSMTGFLAQNQRRRKKSFLQIELDGNELTSLSCDEIFENVVSLNVSRNRINSIKEEDTMHLKMLKFLNVSDNDIHTLEAGCFRNSRLLTELYMSDTHIKNLNNSVQNMSHLRTLHVRSSMLESLSEDDFEGAPHLRILSFRNNSLTSVYGAFRSLKYISSLDIAMNNLTTLTVDSFPPLLGLKSLAMEGNSWSCDCRLGWIFNWLHKRGTKLADNPVCSSPPRLRGLSIRSLTQIVFEEWLEDCPIECQCLCLPDGNNVYTEVDCSQRSLSQLPKTSPSNALLMNVSGNEVDSFDGHDVIDLKELQTLDLENNKINKTALAQLPSNVKTVLLANNKLRFFPVDEVGSIRKLTLSRNPWSCNCGTWKFRNWLMDHNDLVIDLFEVRCGNDENIFLRGRPIVTLTREDLCSVHPPYMLIIILGLVTSLLFGLCLSCCWFRHSVAAVLYSWGLVCIKNERHNMPYDAFLLYSEGDESLAREIAKSLEDHKRPFMICIPNRDIISPRTPERITAFMQQCCKIIVIVTRKFLEDEECMNLFKSSMSFSIDSSTKNIIIVTYGENFVASKLDPALRAIMKSCTCLRWKQRLFWEKLMYSMPKKNDVDELDAETEPFIQEYE